MARSRRRAPAVAPTLVSDLTPSAPAMAPRAAPRGAPAMAARGGDAQNPVTANHRSPLAVTPAKKTAGAKHGDGRLTVASTSASPVAEKGTASVLAATAPSQATIA